MSLAESHVNLLDSIARNAVRLCEGKLCCLRHRRKGSALCLLCDIYNRVNHPMNEYQKHFVAARSTKASTAVGELALVIPRCRTHQFSRSFLPTAVVYGTCCRRARLEVALCSVKSAVNLCLLMASLEIYIYLCLFLLFYNLLRIMVLGPFWLIGYLFS